MSTVRKTHKQYLSQLRSLKCKVRPLEEYVNAQTKILHLCECKSEWLVKPTHVVRGVKCRICKVGRVKATRTIPHEVYVQELSDLGINVKPVEKFIGRQFEIRHKCLDCNHVWNVRPNSFIQRKRNTCPKCARVNCSSNIPHTHERYVAELESVGSCFRPADSYVNAQSRILHRCLHCGNEASLSPCHVKRGQKCRRCTPNAINVSKSAIRWLDILSKRLRLGIQHGCNNKEHRVYKTDGSYMMLDGFNKSKNIAFEFFGDYWHGRRYKNHNTEHAAKFKASITRLKWLVKNDYTVVYVWESDYYMGRNGTIVARRMTPEIEALADKAKLTIRIYN